MKKRVIIFGLVLLICTIMISVPYFRNDVKANSDHIAKIHAVDSDNDRLPDYKEEKLGTDPFNIDTDNDLLTDMDEVYLGTSPLKWDSDTDHVADGNEIGAGKGSTSPFLKDTDNDGLPDPWEDNDGDGLLNREEQLWIHDGLCIYMSPFADNPAASSPNDIDSDNDGWDDGYEVQVNGTHTGSNAVSPPPPLDRANPDLDIADGNSWATTYLTARGWDTATFNDWKNGLKLAGSYLSQIPHGCTKIMWYHFSPWYIYENFLRSDQIDETYEFDDWRDDWYHSPANQSIRGAWNRSGPYDWNQYDCDPTLNDTDSDVMDDNWDPYPLRYNSRNFTFAAVNSIRRLGDSVLNASAPFNLTFSNFGTNVSTLELEKGDIVEINLSVGLQLCNPDNSSHENYKDNKYTAMRVVIRFRPIGLGPDGVAHTNDDILDNQNVAHLTRTFTNVDKPHIHPGMQEINFSLSPTVNSTITFYYQTFEIRIPSRVPAGHIALTVETQCDNNFYYFPSNPYMVY